MKTILVLLAILLPQLRFGGLVLAAQTAWNTEHSWFPPAWAKQLPQRGELKLQFAPGFQNTNSGEFWSYVILYQLEGNVLANRTELERTLKAYDVGLYANAVPETEVSVTLENETRSSRHGHNATQWTGLLKGFDSFFTKRPLTSRLVVTRWFCAASARTFVLIERSPAAADADVWRDLREHGNALVCHTPAIKPRHDRLPDRIAAIESGAGDPKKPVPLAERMRQLGVPGLSVAVLADGRVEWCRAYGVADLETVTPVTTNTLFQAASISKSVTAVAVMRLVEAGKLSLDGDVNAALRSWRVPDLAGATNSPVTIRRILSHTAGFDRGAVGEYSPGENLPTCLDSLLGREPARGGPLRLNATPGTEWNYSGGGFTVLQQLLEDVERTNFPALIRREVFAPLGLRFSTFENLSPFDSRFQLAAGHQTNTTIAGKWGQHPEQAAAGLWTRAADLATLLAELSQAHRKKNGRFLRAESTRELWSSQWRNSGLGFFLNGSGKYRRVNHDGANKGYLSQMVLYPELGLGAVVLTNADEGNDLVQEILGRVAAEYGWPEW